MPKRVHILEGESVEEFDSLAATMHGEFEPCTETEHFLVDQMIYHEWLMRRALRMQQHLLGAVENEVDADPKRMRLIVRYYHTHEKAALQAKRQLESMRKLKQRTEKLLAAGAERESTESRRMRRHWEQILKKMPTLTNWVN